MEFKILTYNIHGGRGTDRRRDYTRIGQFLKKQNVDIALIQEMHVLSSTDLVQMQLDHFKYLVTAPTQQHENCWFGNLILSKFPVIKQNIIDISHKNREPRNILEVFLHTPQGPLHVVNTHKGLSHWERGHQLQKLHSLLSVETGIPLIVGGDINQWHTYSGNLRELDTLLFPLHTSATFPTLMPFLHLDRMWCRPQTIVQSIQVLKTPETKIYSDHFPILSQIKL